MSEKKLGKPGKMPFSTITAKPKKRKSWKRKPSEFKRIYHSKERVQFVNSLPCACCGRTGEWIENAHIETGGIGYKAGFEKIIPLCGRRAPKFSCHRRMHDHGLMDLALWGVFDPYAVAEQTQSAWESFRVAGGGKE